MQWSVHTSAIASNLIFTRRMMNKSIEKSRQFNLFHATGLFLYPLKTSKKRFQGVWKETNDMKWVKALNFHDRITEELNHYLVLSILVWLIWTFSNVFLLTENCFLMANITPLPRGCFIQLMATTLLKTLYFIMRLMNF